MISRGWCQRNNVQTIGLLIADEIQLVGGEVGPTYEVIISRTRYMSAQTEIKTGIVVCGVSLASARGFGERTVGLRLMQSLTSHQGSSCAYVIWRQQLTLGYSAHPLDMDIRLQSFNIPHFPSLMIAISKPAYLAIVKHSPTKPVIIFVPSRRQCQSRKVSLDCVNGHLLDISLLYLQVIELNIRVRLC